MSYTHRDILFEKFQLFFAGHRVKDAKILEIGAGATNAQNWFKDIGLFDYTGIDNGSEYMQPGITKMDAHNLTFEDNTFDIVYMSHTAEHFENPVRAFSEIRRVLKPNGILFSVTPWPCEHQILLGDQSHICVLYPLQWQRILKNAKFSTYYSEVQMTWQGKQIPKEQDFMICSVGMK
jgi:ubiquinone/menaquinone biosynthesis C-methylase UbiE